MFVLVAECFLAPEALDVEAGAPHLDPHALQLQDQPDQAHLFGEAGPELRAHEVGEGQAGQFLHRLGVVFLQRLANAGSQVGLGVLEEGAGGLRFGLRCEVPLLLVLLEGELVAAVRSGRGGLRRFPGHFPVVEAVLLFWLLRVLVARQVVVEELRASHSKVIKVSAM